MKAYSVYKLKYLDGRISVFNRLLDAYQDYNLTTTDKRSINSFRYLINTKLNGYGSTDNAILMVDNKTLDEMGLELAGLEKYDFLTFLKPHLDEYYINTTRKLNLTSKYANSSVFHKRIFKLAKNKIDVNLFDIDNM